LSLILKGWRRYKIMMTDRKISKGEHAINKLVRERYISPEGAAWLRVALDPFTDDVVQSPSFPDNSNFAVVTYPLKQSLTFKHPPVVTAGNWDCHICFTPTLGRVPLSVNTTIPSDFGNWLPINGTIDSAIGTIEVIGNAPTLALDFINTTSTNNFCGHLEGIADELTDGYRVVGIGFEVHDTTAVLNKQGLCTVYRVPESATPQYMNYCDSNVPYGNFAEGGEVVRFNNPPSNPAQALAFLGTRQWEAKEGAYIVCPMSNAANPFKQFMSTGHYISGADRRTLKVTQAIAGPSGTQHKFPRNILLPYSQCGVMLTGLAFEASITVNLTMYIERAPSSHNSWDLARMARQSAPYDPVALAIYSEALSSLPVGVMVKENGLGDWFMDVVNKITSFATPMLGMIPHPLAQAGSQVSRVVNQMTAKNELQKGGNSFSKKQITPKSKKILTNKEVRSIKSKKAPQKRGFPKK
jgi:hypothetical protein